MDLRGTGGKAISGATGLWEPGAYRGRAPGGGLRDMMGRIMKGGVTDRGVNLVGKIAVGIRRRLNTQMVSMPQVTKWLNTHSEVGLDAGGTSKSSSGYGMPQHLLWRVEVPGSWKRNALGTCGTHPLRPSPLPVVNTVLAGASLEMPPLPRGHIRTSRVGLITARKP